jgi:hypothetical protein
VAISSHPVLQTELLKASDAVRGPTPRGSNPLDADFNPGAAFDPEEFHLRICRYRNMTGKAQGMRHKPWVLAAGAAAAPPRRDSVNRRRADQRHHTTPRQRSAATCPAGTCPYHDQHHHQDPTPDNTIRGVLLSHPNLSAPPGTHGDPVGRQPVEIRAAHNALAAHRISAGARVVGQRCVGPAAHSMMCPQRLSPGNRTVVIRSASFANECK